MAELWLYGSLGSIIGFIALFKFEKYWLLTKLKPTITFAPIKFPQGVDSVFKLENKE